MDSPCKCSDCTRCPYDWCIDESKENEGKADQTENIYKYYILHKDEIARRSKERREYRKANKLCVRCGKPATRGLYCGIHKDYLQMKSKEYYARKAK